MEFYRSFLGLLKRDYLKNAVICGNVNTAHKEIDLARLEENSKVSVFLPQEREWIDELLESGFVDAYRYLHPSSEKYAWWDLRTRVRERDVRWRTDYFFITGDVLPNLEGGLHEVQGSDHCPITIELGF